MKVPLSTKSQKSTKFNKLSFKNNRPKNIKIPKNHKLSNKTTPRTNSNVYDIDNFIIQPSSVKIVQKRIELNAILIPKYNILDENFYNLDTNNESDTEVNLILLKYIFLN